MNVIQGIDSFMLGLDGIHSRATVAWYRYMLKDLGHELGDVELAKVSEDHLNRWRARLIERKYSVWTVRDYLRAARAFFRWAVLKKLLRHSPAEKVKMPKAPVRPRLGISDSDRDLILAAAGGNLRDLALVRFIGDTMCRAGGAAELRWKDVDLERRRAMVHEKGDKIREVYFGELTVAAMAEWQGQCKSEWVFPSKKGGHLKPNGIYEVFSRLAKKTGVLERWNPHQWRHGGARAMLRNHANLAQVSQLLGHSSVLVTVQFYGTLAGDELAECRDRFGWMG